METVILYLRYGASHVLNHLQARMWSEPASKMRVALLHRRLMPRIFIPKSFSPKRVGGSNSSVQPVHSPRLSDARHETGRHGPVDVRGVPPPRLERPRNSWFASR